MLRPKNGENKGFLISLLKKADLLSDNRYSLHFSFYEEGEEYV